MRLIKFNWLVLFAASILLAACSGGDSVPMEPETANDNAFEKMVLSKNFSGAVLVVDQGAVLLKSGFGKVNRELSQDINADTVFRLGSISKQFTSAAIMLLHEQQVIDIEAPLGNYLPDYPGGEDISVRNLLQHTSGIPNYTNLPEINSLLHIHHDPDQLVELFKDLPLEFAPGSEYKYSNSNYVLLGYLIETMSGQRYEEFISDNIFVPLNMSRSGYGENTHGPDNIAFGYLASGETAPTISMSIPYAAGALVSSLNDLYLWDQSFYDNALLQEETKVITYTPGLNDYALGWNIGRINNNVVYAHGGGIFGFSSFILRVPGERRLIVVLSNVGRFSARALALDLNELIDSP